MARRSTVCDGYYEIWVFSRHFYRKDKYWRREGELIYSSFWNMGLIYGCSCCSVFEVRYIVAIGCNKCNMWLIHVWSNMSAFIIYLFIYLFQFYFNRVDPIQDHFWSCSSREPCFNIKIHTFNIQQNKIYTVSQHKNHISNIQRHTKIVIYIKLAVERNRDRTDVFFVMEWQH